MEELDKDFKEYLENEISESLPSEVEMWLKNKLNNKE